MQPLVYYGYDSIPGARTPLHGGMVKFQRLQTLFPNTMKGYNIIYIGSSSMPSHWESLLKQKEQNNVKLVWNQDGVGYKGWAPGCEVENWAEAVNKPMARLLHAADYVFYQSVFSKMSADIFLGEKVGDNEILYNAVDTRIFTPAASPRGNEMVLLLGGTQYHFDKVETALRTVALLKQRGHCVRLLITGKLCWPSTTQNHRSVADNLGKDLGIEDCIEYIGFHDQESAPRIYQRAHILLHPKYNDPCPGVVVEALACGLPVVYSASGGVPELVGDKAGIGISAPVDFERYHIPDFSHMADAVEAVYKDYDAYSNAARERAVERFDLIPWIERHKDIFERLSTI